MSKREAPVGILTGGLCCLAPLLQDLWLVPTASAPPVRGNAQLWQPATHSHPLPALVSIPGNGTAIISCARKLSEAREGKEMIRGHEVK